MKEYDVTVTRTLRATVTVEAADEEEAEQKALEEIAMDVSVWDEVQPDYFDVDEV